MVEKAIQKIVRVLKESSEVIHGIPFFNESIYKGVGFEKTNFRLIADFTPETSGKIVCVDGGNLEIISTPTFSVSLIRVAGLCFKGVERTKSKFPHRIECFCVVKTVFESDERKFQILYFPVKEEHAEFLPTSYMLKAEPGRVEALWELNLKPISLISNYARKYAEWFYLNRILDGLEEGDVVLRDGIFQTTDEIEAEIAKNIYEKAKSMGVGLAALAKTTSLLTTTGIPVVQVLQSLADQWNIKAPWYYFPIAENLEPECNADIYFVKFSDATDYVFRFEVMRSTLAEPHVLLLLLYRHSKNCIFPGYPYILLAADKIARVEKKEGKPLYLRLHRMLGTEIQRAIKAIDAHDMVSRY